MTETATATNPTEASASSATPATLLASAGSETDNTQQTQNAETQTQSAETHTNDDQKGGETKTEGAPETYTFTAPEGTEFAPEIIESFSGAAKEAGLTQEAAQKVIEKMAPVLIARQVDQVQAIHKEWFDASSADKEFGGEKLAENLGVARKALDSFGTPELRALLDETGLGNHPEVIRMLYRAGKAISEDQLVGGRTRTGDRDAAAVLYDQTKKG